MSHTHARQTSPVMQYDLFSYQLLALRAISGLSMAPTHTHTEAKVPGAGVINRFSGHSGLTGCRQRGVKGVMT